MNGKSGLSMCLSLQKGREKEVMSFMQKALSTDTETRESFWRKKHTKTAVAWKRQQNKMEARHYINMFSALLRKMQFSMNFEQDKAVQIAIAVMHEMSKDRRVEEMKKEREIARQELATARQLAYAKVLGIEVSNRLTKKEAGRLIEQKIVNRNGRSNSNNVGRLVSAPTRSGFC